MGQKSDQRDAFALFPDLMKNLVGAKHGKERAVRVRPPSLPDLSWLRTGTYQEPDKAKNIPTALVLMDERQGSSTVVSALHELGYRVDAADSPLEALVKLKSTNFAAVVMHTDFGGESLARSKVYNYITWLPVSKRRTIFFILVGPHLRTMYDLEALSLSVNLVMNDANVRSLKPILKKSFREHEELFGPLIEAMDGCETL